MADFIRKRQRVFAEAWQLYFERRGDEGSGYAFPCDKAGNVDEAALEPAGLLNYQHCMAGSPDLKPPVVEHLEWEYIEPAVIRCGCKREVMLDCDPAECECGCAYNLFGQQLAHHSQWGEETGEYFGGGYDY